MAKILLKADTKEFIGRYEDNQEFEIVNLTGKTVTEVDIDIKNAAPERIRVWRKPGDTAWKKLIAMPTAPIKYENSSFVTTFDVPENQAIINVGLSAPEYESSNIPAEYPSYVNVIFTAPIQIENSTGWTVKVNTIPRTIAVVGGSGTDTAVLVLASDIVYGDVVTVEYTAGGSATLKDMYGALLDSITEKPVINNVAEIPAGGQFASSLTQFGITWTFDGQYEYKQYANGEYAVKGPVNIISISPAPAVVSGRTLNGSMINPTPDREHSGTQGYDSALAATFGNQFAGTVGLNISVENPLVVANGSSLVSSISVPTAQSIPNSQIQTCAVLTVVATLPADGSFRPPYSGTDKSVKFNKSQILYNVLPELSLTGITSLPTATTLTDNNVSNIADKIKHPLIDHYCSQGAFTQGGSPIDNYPNYGREFMMMMGDVSLLLLCNSSQLLSLLNVTKEQLAIGIIQIGIDLYETLKNGNYWLPVGGLNGGRKWPILLAGLLLNDTDMKNVGSFSFTSFSWGTANYYNNLYGTTNYPVTIPFMEDSQIFYVDQKAYDNTHVDYWGDISHTPFVGNIHDQGVCVPYSTTDFGMPEWGEFGEAVPVWADKYFSYDNYRLTCNANAYVGFALAARVLESTCQAKTLYNKNAFFDYMDRCMALRTKGDWRRAWSKFQEKMWDAYRADYGYGYIGLVSVNGSTVITNTIDPTTGYDGVTGTRTSTATESASCLFAITTSQFSSITGFIGSSQEAVSGTNNTRLYGDCVQYGIVQ